MMQPELKKAFGHYQLSQEVGTDEETEYFLQRFLVLRDQLWAKERKRRRFEFLAIKGELARRLTDAELHKRAARMHFVHDAQSKAAKSEGEAGERARQASITYFHDYAQVLDAEIEARASIKAEILHLKDNIKAIQARMETESADDAIVTYKLIRSPRLPRITQIKAVLPTASIIPNAIQHESLSDLRHLT